MASKTLLTKARRSTATVADRSSETVRALNNTRRRERKAEKVEGRPSRATTWGEGRLWY